MPPGSGSSNEHHRTVKLHAQVVGAGPPVVLSTGIGQSSSAWASLVGTLKDRFAVLSWDYRGHGRSPASDNPADYSSRLALTDLNSMIERAGATPENKCALVGHSLGGYLSLRSAIENCAVIKALVLIATGPGFRDDTAREEWNVIARSLPMDDDVHPPARAMSFQSDNLVMEKLRTIAVPTLVIVGSEDRRFIGAKNYMVKKMSQVTGIEIEGAKHSVHTSHSMQVNAAVSNFLNEVFFA
jgi:pimeloyl-ACP methyl ester carboxylesterase